MYTIIQLKDLSKADLIDMDIVFNANTHVYEIFSFWIGIIFRFREIIKLCLPNTWIYIREGEVPFFIVIGR